MAEIRIFDGTTLASRRFSPMSDYEFHGAFRKTPDQKIRIRIQFYYFFLIKKWEGWEVPLLCGMKGMNVVAEGNAKIFIETLPGRQKLRLQWNKSGSGISFLSLGLKLLSIWHENYSGNSESRVSVARKIRTRARR
jgi:hypothetical protein